MTGYLDALARAAGWSGSDPGLPARPRSRSRFEPEPDDDGPSWLLSVEDEVPSVVLGDVPPPVTDPGGRDREGSGPDRAPARPASPPAVAVAPPSVARPLDVPPVPVGAADTAAADGLRAADPAPPGRTVVDVVPAAAAPAPPSRAADPGADAVGPPSTGPSPTAAARPVPVLDAADLDDHHRPAESGDDHRRPYPDPRDGDPGDEPPPRPRATARPGPSVVVDDPLVRPAEAAERATPPPVIIEIGRIEVRIAAGGSPGPSAAAPSRAALPAPGPTLADYLDGLAGAAGRRP